MGAFSLLTHSEIILHWVESLSLTLHDDVIFSAFDVIRAAILDFTIFLASQKITEIDTKARQNAYGM